MIAVNVINKFEKVILSDRKIIKLIRDICKIFKIKNAVINIQIVSDKQITKINKEFLNHNKITDCISFDLTEGIKTAKLFDIVVNAQLAAKKAKLLKNTPSAELALYITHGLLHNIGFDDLEPKKAEKMHKMEDEILVKLGYGKVYQISEA